MEGKGAAFCVLIVYTLMQGMGKVEDELKQLTSVYSEKKQSLSAMQRKRG